VKFYNQLSKIIKKNKSLLCVGLDPDPQLMPKGFPFAQNEEALLFEFNKWIIDQTFQFVCAYKPQIAFYAANGQRGIENLKKTIEYIHSKYPEIPVVLDAKRGDVGHTSQMYAKEVFDFFRADATTVNPYCGFDSLEPFFKREDKGIFVICRTSNPGASDFQDLRVGTSPLYVEVAKKIISWNKNYPNVFLEIGATWPQEIGTLRNLASDMLFLIAGIGAQGGDLKATLENGLTAARKGLIINSSRGIIYAQDPKKAAQDLKNEINKYRK